MEPSDRLRPHPRERLPSAEVVDLASAVSGLRAEAHDAVAGHRQIALGRHGPVTLLLFAFDAGGYLQDHQAGGVVTIHVLRGRVQLSVGEDAHEMAAGQLVTLAPQVRHAVRASEPSELLVTVHKLPD